jgi:hypothetical protein
MILIKTLSASAVLVVVLAISSGTTWAAPCSVPGDHPTIQAAVNDVGCDPINVAPGNYPENVVIPRSLTLNGAQAGNSYVTRVSGGPLESTVTGVTTVGASATITIDAADVTVDGFTLKNNTNTVGAAHGVMVRGLGNDAAILNNIFDDIRTADTTGNGTAQAVYLTAGGPDNVNIQDNEMKNIQSNRSAKGVLIGDNNGANPSQNVQVKGNFIHDVTSDTRGAYGVSVANPLTGQGGVSGLKVSENTISNLTGGGWVHGIGLEGDTPNAMVLSNDISNITDGTPSPINDAVAVFFENNASYGTAMVNSNNFYVTALQFGIAVHPALASGFPNSSVNGECNWWNSPSGPTTASNPGGTGAQVSSNVDYAPWLIAPAPEGECIGGNVPTTTDQCKKGGWMTSVRSDGSTFKNQGDCMQYVNTGK